jgi:16S rRNA (guanine527-N7)-methyltransferase
MIQILQDGLLQLIFQDKNIAAVLENKFDEKLAKLFRYIEEIELFNSAYGLVGTSDTKELIIKHILDSLAPLGIIAETLQQHTGLQQYEKPLLADAGSGAGLPGIPLAICLDQPFTLIERMGKRAGFLRNTLAVLGLDKVEVEEKDVEKARQNRYSLITFRAFKPLEPDLLKSLFKLLVPGGVLAAYKGKAEKIDEEMSAIENLCGGWKTYETPVPFLDEERHVVIISSP